MFKKFWKNLCDNKNTLKFEKRKLTRHDAELFYTLKKYYNPTAPNIAVFGDKEKFENLIAQYTRFYKYRKDFKIIRITDSKITFISDDIELTIVLINEMLDLLHYNITYRKYL